MPAEGVDIIRYPGCDFTTAEEYYCSGLYDIDPEVFNYLCETPEVEGDPEGLIDDRLYPNCDGTPNELPCDELDNDGDGDIDEGSTFATAYDWTWDGAGANNGGGTIGATSASYDPVTEILTFSTTLTDPSGAQSNAFTFAVSDGPNPKGKAELALFYFDATGASPVVTVYAYNGENTFTSYYDGSSDAGTQAPDFIASSLIDNSFVLDASASRSGNTVTFSLTVDATEINNHIPLYLAPWEWVGVDVGEKFGLWYHPFAGSSFTYVDGKISNFSYSKQGWLDLNDKTTVSVPVCH